MVNYAAFPQALNQRQQVEASTNCSFLDDDFFLFSFLFLYLTLSIHMVDHLESYDLFPISVV